MSQEHIDIKATSQFIIWQLNLSLFVFAGGRRALHPPVGAAGPGAARDQQHHELGVQQAVQPGERLPRQGRRRRGKQLGVGLQPGKEGAESLDYLFVTS